MKTTALVISVTLAICFSSCASRSTSSETKATTSAAITTTTTEATTVTTVPKATTEAVTTTTSVTANASTTPVSTTTKVESSSTATGKEKDEPITPAVTTKASASQDTTTSVSVATEEKTSTTTANTTTTKKATTTKVSTTTAKKATTTVAKKAEPVKKRVQLYVENIQQVPELPMGCEAVSGSIALKWYGFKVDKFSLLPYQPMMEQPTKDGVWGDPNQVFVGNPRTFKWGCYSPVIKKAIEDYFADNHVTDYEVISLDGSDFVDLYQEIDDGNPIILWVTTWMQDLEKGESWKLEDGSTFVWTKHEHCVCLIGYDTQKDTVIISDPYDSKGTVEYPRAKVEKVYKQLGNMALVIHKKESNGIFQTLLNFSKR